MADGKPGRPATPKDSTGERDPRKAFIETAESRTAKVLQALDLLAKTANQKSYNYEADWTAQIVSALREAVDRLEAAYKAGSVKTSGFTLGVSE